MLVIINSMITTMSCVGKKMTEKIQQSFMFVYYFACRFLFLL